MNKKEFEARIKAIPVVPPDEEDKAAIKRIAKTKDQPTITKAQLISEIEYSGKISLRVPKELHEELAKAAAANGVSLNQYALYKLSR